MSSFWFFSACAVLGFFAILLIGYSLRKSVSLVASISLFAAIFVSIMYWHFGAYPQLREYEQSQAIKAQAQDILKSIKGPDEIIERLQQRLKSEPESAKGWYLLGRLYASKGSFDNALEAFAKAHEIEPDNEQTTINYAQSLWYQNDQKFNQQTRDLFSNVLLNNPKQPDALAMLAMDSFQEKKYKQAIVYWRRLLKLIPPESDDAKAVRKALAKAEELGQ